MRAILYVVVLLLGGITASAQTFNRSLFYDAYADNSLWAVDNTINLMWDSTFREKEAYLGALFMKKAAILSNLNDKIPFVKQGHEKMENAIKMDPSNAEYRFLRLTIQEGVSSTLGYNKNLDEDAQIVRERYEYMPIEVQKAIADYSLHSKVLGNVALK